jgi:hypothetical protein
MARSALSYWGRKLAKDAPVIGRMKVLSTQYPRDGYHRIRIFLGRDGAGAAQAAAEVGFGRAAAPASSIRAEPGLLRARRTGPEFVSKALLPWILAQGIDTALKLGGMASPRLLEHEEPPSELDHASPDAGIASPGETFFSSPLAALVRRAGETSVASDRSLISQVARQYLVHEHVCRLNADAEDAGQQPNHRVRSFFRVMFQPL